MSVRLGGTFSLGSVETWISARPSRTAVLLVLAAALLVGELQWRADYRDFLNICNHDNGAILRTDELIASGKHPGTDFFYYYGLLPVLWMRGWFAAFGRSPQALVAFHMVGTAVYGSIVIPFFASLRPTRLGLLLGGAMIGYYVPLFTPTAIFESTLLSGAIICWFKGSPRAAIALATVGVFAKISMATVLLAGLLGLLALRAVRDRRVARLAPAAAVAVGLLVAGALVIAFGLPSVLATSDPRAGAGAYRAEGVGFFGQGSAFWMPHAGHVLAWYIGSVAGGWILATITLVVQGVSSGTRLVRDAVRGAAAESDFHLAEHRALTCLGHVAFLAVFFPPAIPHSYYGWLLFVGLAPTVAPLRLAFATRPVTSLALATIAALILVPAPMMLKGAWRFFARPPATFAGLSSTPDYVDDWKKADAEAHALGHVAFLGRVANFHAVDPTIEEGPYWMIMPGMRLTESVGETERIVRNADAVILARFDLPLVEEISAFHELAEHAPRVYEGRHFIVVHGGAGTHTPGI